MRSETDAVLVLPDDYEQAKEGAKKAAERGLCRLVFTDPVLLDRWLSAVAAHQESPHSQH